MMYCRAKQMRMFTRTQTTSEWGVRQRFYDVLRDHPQNTFRSVVNAPFCKITLSRKRTRNPVETKFSGRVDETLPFACNVIFIYSRYKINAGRFLWDDVHSRYVHTSDINQTDNSTDLSTN
jgi:hypothetical protein